MSQESSPDASPPPPQEPLATLPGWRVRYRTLLSVSAHGVLFALSLLIAFALKYDFRLEMPWFREQYLIYLPLTLLVKLIVFARLRLYRDSWRYVGLRDLFNIVKA